MPRKHHNTTEPNVIHEDLILDVVADVRSRDRDRLAARHLAASSAIDRQHREPVTILDYPTVTELNFGYQNILRVDNLQGFLKLTKLQLDNNIIERIEGIAHLECLEWLDLSFNNIAKIEGLETLTKLKTLTLYSNRISELEGLDTLRDLEVFSCGANAIAALENVMYLRQFANLRMVNLAQNPIAASPEYRQYILAHLKGVRFLDYRLIDPSAVSAAREQYQDELLELEEREKIESAEAQEQRRITERRAELRRCNLEGVDTLLQDVLNEDPELPRLKLINCLAESLPEFHASFDRVTTPFIAEFLANYAEREAERAEYEAVMGGNLEMQEEKCAVIIRRFEADKKNVLRLVGGGDAPGDVLDERLESLLRDLDHLHAALMELEVTQADTSALFLGAYEKGVREKFERGGELISAYFVALRELEEINHSHVLAAATAQYDRCHAGELDAAIADEGRQLLQDKDTLLNIVNGSHDQHVFRIDAREDELMRRESDLLEEWLSGAHARENRRNRTRVAEILGFVMANKTEISDFLEGEG
eukprot:TRINITY_DN586_c0_g1_i1.p1 TRINITY_DN586_c0_g1~~TRINITY_DN586_c0_g1_i1.p1  ORF type:complete len:537 (+),score=144.25 TRINITY_DN586_c0_g1_i1:244-1854(+)